MGKNKKISKRKQKEDFGSVEIHCSKCNHRFEIPWETIWDIQEITHGYVGYHLYGTYTSCEKCGEICTGEENVEEKKSIGPITDDNLPF
ncbi:hypothetical protein [Neobacillus niacini]|uniref:hypothetical protein n=1 Tax=Neobacillus niacini TaxID=86668 RepID=UPI00286475D2|nr:hypothetical protein [Neobacillus niacini]MDR7002624.1 formylmethanofuran dehydrogenase subunit E [Neobacillus niacini]